MDCSSCGRELPEGQRFCGWCGAPAQAPGAERPADALLEAMIADYRKELEDRPDDSVVLFNLATALERGGRLGEALALLKRVEATEPGDKDVEKAMRRVERKIGGQ